jgi:hypothetical protein
MSVIASRHNGNSTSAASHVAAAGIQREGESSKTCYGGIAEMGGGVQRSSE